MALFQVKDLLAKFKNFGAAKAAQKSQILLAIKQATSADLKTTDLNLKGGIVYIKSGGALKNLIGLHKGKIISNINSTNDTPPKITDIR